MNYDALTAEMNNIINLMSKEGPESDQYDVYMKRLSALQKIALDWQDHGLAEQRQKEELSLRRREQSISEEEILARTGNSKREARTEYGKTVLGGVFTLGAILMTQVIEEHDIIRTKGWGFINSLIHKI